MLKFNFFNKIILFFVLFSFIDLNGFHKIHSYSKIPENIFTNCTKETLITFDVDDTLITSLDFITRDLEHSFWLYAYLVLKFPNLFFNPNKLEKVISILVRDCRRSVFDKEIFKVINKFKQKKCNIIALTDMRNSGFGVIDSLPKWRAKTLKSFGFDFSGKFTNKTFDNLKAYKKSYPCFYSGILCTNKLPKGAILGAFIDYYGLKPDKVISFDDLEYQLDSIYTECKKRNIPFLGIQPLGAKNIAVNRSFKLAAQQINNVLKTNE